MRRTTLGPASSSQLNARPSALRHPSTRVSVPSKSTATTDRQSFGTLPRRRVSTATNHTARRPPTGPRISINSRNSAGSAAAARRSSSYRARASISGRNGARVLDPRPVTDRVYLNNCVRTLVEFLTDRMFDQSLTPKLLKRGLSKKDFCNVVLFLFKQIDSNFEFGVKFEEDIVLQFRNLRYPFPISKTSLAAVGTPHTWPTLLLSISWLIELLSYDEARQEAEEIELNDEKDEENGDKQFFKYLDASYRVFLAGEDDKFAEWEKQEKEKLIKRDETVKQEMSQQELQQEEFRKRIEQAKADKNALSELKQKKADCQSDLVKFKELVGRYETLNGKLDKKVEALVEVQQSLENDVRTLQEEIQKFHTRIENQELSAHDIEQISLERARLTDQLHHNLARQDELQTQIKSYENRAASIRDNLDNQIHEYWNICKGLKIIPATAKYARNFDYTLELDPDLEELEAVQKLSHHLKTNVRQTALKLKQNRNARANEGLDLALVLTEELEQSENQLSIEKQTEKRWESEVKKYADQMTKEREKRAESLSRKQAAIEEVEIKITNISNEDSLVEEEAISSQQHLLDVRKASVEIMESYQALLDKNRHAVTNVLMACTNHKDMVDRIISSLEAELSKVEL
ncbi:unnamed protein product [Peronospora farinosa]|uniref:Kinetochore protein NDC80 n=1 Tax=Peronospora farinosa TaxID=134698 RepID=A0AAV0UNM1_9STRA|nr:unnamed protein product [Peronospora farinosa]CAI5736284.1 unnamed protein product [Peronospora farinosa]